MGVPTRVGVWGPRARSNFPTPKPGRSRASCRGGITRVWGALCNTQLPGVSVGCARQAPRWHPHPRAPQQLGPRAVPLTRACCCHFPPVASRRAGREQRRQRGSVRRAQQRRVPAAARPRPQGGDAPSTWAAPRPRHAGCRQATLASLAPGDEKTAGGQNPDSAGGRGAQAAGEPTGRIGGDKSPRRRQAGSPAPHRMAPSAQRRRRQTLTRARRWQGKRFTRPAGSPRAPGILPTPTQSTARLGRPPGTGSCGQARPGLGEGKELRKGKAGV